MTTDNDEFKTAPITDYPDIPHCFFMTFLSVV